MSEFKKYRRSKIAELAKWEPGMVIDHVSISAEDLKAGSPKDGDMIARNPANHKDMWLVAKEYFKENFEMEEKQVSERESQGEGEPDLDFYGRLVREHKELVIKFEALAKFINSTKFQELSSANQVLLTNQLAIMSNYDNVLVVRLELLKK